jgi:hypothetical protein
MFENSILFKSVYCYLTRFVIYRTSASGRRGRKAKASKRRESTTKMKRPEDALDSRVLHCLCGACMRSDTKLVLIHEVPYIFNHVMLQVRPGYVVRQCFYMASIHEGLHKSEMGCRLSCGSQHGPAACARPKSLGRYNNMDDPGGFCSVARALPRHYFAKAVHRGLGPFSSDFGLLFLFLRC